MIQGTGGLGGDRGLLEACWQLFDFRGVPKRPQRESEIGQQSREALGGTKWDLGLSVLSGTP